MQLAPSIHFRPLFSLLAALVILKVTLSVLVGYRDYFPPNFKADFLAGRQTYFYGPYQWAFYIHLAAGPPALLLGLILTSNRFRLRFANWHRAGQTPGADCPLPARAQWSVDGPLRSKRRSGSRWLLDARHLYGDLCGAGMARRDRAPLRGTSPLDDALLPALMLRRHHSARRRAGSRFWLWSALALSG